MIKDLDFYCVLLIFFSKYAWVVHLKDKKGITMVNTFQKILDKSGPKPNLIWEDKGSGFYNSYFKKWLKIIIFKCIHYIMKENL